MKNKLVLFIVFTLLFADIQMAMAQIITSIAGNGTQGYSGDGGAAIASQLHGPSDMIKDPTGNIFICDGQNNCIRKVNTVGTIISVAGNGSAGYNGDGIAATAALLSYPSSITLDGAGNLYFTDDHNYRIRKISTSGVITSIAGTGISGFNGDGTAASSASIGSTSGIVVDNYGVVYFTDITNRRIRKISAAGIISTIAGTGSYFHSGDNGPATAANLQDPVSLSMDKTGNIYFAEHGGNTIRKINTSGIITSIVGTGVLGYSGDGGAATDCELYNPFCVTIDNSGNLYLADAGRIRMVATGGIISTIAGNNTNGPDLDGVSATDASLRSPVSVKIDNSGSIYIAESGADKVRYVRNPTTVNALDNVNRSINIYPNPSNGNFIVDISTPEDEKIEIIFSTITGRKLKRISGITNKPINVGLNVPSGVYLLRVINGDDMWSQKVVVAK